MTARQTARSATLALSVCTLAVTGAVVAGGPASAGENRTTVLRTALTGAQEVPGPGDPDGSGRGQLRIKAATGEICYDLRVRDIAKATAAHIHEADRTKAGPVVLPLAAPADGRSKGCFSKDALEALGSEDLAQEIVANPANYYFNVHNGDFKAGAVRGQLGE